MQNIHIVFGRSKGTLTHSNEPEFGHCHIISFEDNLNIGPLCGLGDNEAVSRRKDWLQKISGESSCVDYILPPVDQDLKNLKTLSENIGKYDKIYLWTGHSASEMIGTARLLFHMPMLNNIFIADFPNIGVANIHGNTGYPNNLTQTAPFQVKDILKQFKLVNQSELQRWTDLWDRLSKGRGNLRILDKNGDILNVGEDYFDSVLLSACNDNFQNAVRAIIPAFDLDFAIDGDYLNWRLKHLALTGKIEAQGKLVEMRDYEVRRRTVVP